MLFSPKTYFGKKTNLKTNFEEKKFQNKLGHLIQRPCTTAGNGKYNIYFTKRKKDHIKFEKQTIYVPQI